MMRVALIALMAAGLALPACAQRGGGHGGGGFAGHSAAGFHGGFAAPHFSRGFTARPYSYGARRYSRSSSAYPRYRSGFRAPYVGRDYYRPNRYQRSYLGGYGVPLFYAIPDWIGLGTEGCYPDASDYSVYDGDADNLAPDCAGSVAGPAAGPDQPTIYGDDGQGPPAPPPDYAPPAYEPPAQSPRSSQIPANEVATTIVFNDGRPSEQVHNYALTRTTLFVLDQQQRDIPLDQINLAETEKVNRAVGIPFQVPSIPQ
ncbi:MAG: hypothetical protein WA634_10665 [Silvibacterium sp.]